MLGSRRFSEVSELNKLWQLASKNETVSYSKAQESELIATSDLAEAKTVRQAFAEARVVIVANDGSFRFRANDAAYRRPSAKGTKGMVGKVSMGLAVVGVLMHAGTASAAEPPTPPVSAEQLDNTESNCCCGSRSATTSTTR